MAIDDSYTKVLLHMNEADASPVFTDESNKVWTTYGTAQIDTAQSKFGGSSGLFDGNSDYIRTPYTSDFNLSGNFTIDTWFRAVSFAAVMSLLGKDKYGVSFDWNIYISNTTTIALYTQGYSQNITVTVPTMSINTWYHVAVVSSSGIVSIYLGGILAGSKSLAITNASQDYITIGCQSWNNPGYFFNGWIDELRISNGIARWTANFTPPTSEYISGGSHSAIRGRRRYCGNVDPRIP